MRRTLAALVLGVTVLISVLQATPADAASAGEFTSRINDLRASKGLAALSSDGRLAGQAQQWAEKMASVNAISHNPNLGGTPGNWTKVGENVGTGGSVDAIFNALVASPGHYRNMVDSSFNSIGIGIAMGSDGRIYTCHVFAAFPGKTAAQPASTPASAAPAPKPAPAATAAKAPATTAAPKKAASKSTPTTTKAPATPVTAAPQPEPTSAPAPTPPAPVPAPSLQIVSGLAELGSLATQG